MPQSFSFSLSLALWPPGSLAPWLPLRPPGKWDPIISWTRTPPPGFHSCSVYRMALSSWAPLTDNERRQPMQLQAKHSAFYRPKHVSGKLTMSIQFCSAFNSATTVLLSESLSPAHPIPPSKNHLSSAAPGPSQSTLLPCCCSLWEFYGVERGTGWNKMALYDKKRGKKLMTSSWVSGPKRYAWAAYRAISYLLTTL